MRRKKHRKIQQVSLKESAYKQIMETIGSLPPETGGMLFGTGEEQVIEEFVFDPHGRRSGAAYDPDFRFYDKTIKRMWKKHGLRLVGCIHSHPRGAKFLSGRYSRNTGDIAYIEQILSEFPELDHFIAPIIFSSSDGKNEAVHCFVVPRENPDGYYEVPVKIVTDEVSEPTSTLPLGKLQGGVDIDAMAGAHVVCVGVGGANGICESLVRTGLGAMTIIDYDKVDESNIVTQGYFPDEVGIPKVEALAARLTRINPNLFLQVVDGNLLELSDEDNELIFANASLVLWMTDSFEAQRAGNDIHVKYQVPSIFGQMYEYGVGSDISFHVPGITEGCHRCSFPERYEAYEINGYQNKVTSEGCINAHINYINSVITNLAVAILHSGDDEVVNGGWLYPGMPNVIQLRQSPKFDNPVFEDLNEFSMCFDSAWFTTEKDLRCETCSDIKDTLEV